MPNVPETVSTSKLLKALKDLKKQKDALAPNPEISQSVLEKAEQLIDISLWLDAQNYNLNDPEIRCILDAINSVRSTGERIKRD